MYVTELEERAIPLGDLYLDPNNPRFTDRSVSVPDQRTPEPAVQARAEERISPMGVEELCQSILRNGFLPLDRIVVRELSGVPGKFVAVEGNRRLAALRLLDRRIEQAEISVDDLDEDYLANLSDSIQTVNCLVYTGDDSDVAWILQGIRHISGIRDWTPAQRAELVVREKTERSLSLRAIGQMLGLSTQAVTRLYRGHKGLQQMLDDEDYADRADKTYFTLFDEAYGKRVVRDWLGWSDTDESYVNDENRRLFYSWISKDPEHDGARRIHDPRQIGALNQLLAAGRDDLIQKVDAYEISIDEAKGRLDQRTEANDWAVELARAKAAVGQIPLTALIEQRQELTEALEQLATTVQRLLDSVASDGAPPTS